MDFPLHPLSPGAARLSSTSTHRRGLRRLFTLDVTPAPLSPGFPLHVTMSPSAICSQERNQFPRTAAAREPPSPLMGVWNAGSCPRRVISGAGGRTQAGARPGVGACRGGMASGSLRGSSNPFHPDVRRGPEHSTADGGPRPVQQDKRWPCAQPPGSAGPGSGHFLRHKRVASLRDPVWSRRLRDAPELGVWLILN